MKRGRERERERERERALRRFPFALDRQQALNGQQKVDRRGHSRSPLRGAHTARVHAVQALKRTEQVELIAGGVDPSMHVMICIDAISRPVVY